ncbi:tyrosine-type recombinase/integrase [Synechococcus sp. CC9605]|uniref:tyrosine-type recombinase/integrase n=1 Tax=Synechococcus sp. (strain CC9605) TaxID=110662 RepID=UPI00005D5BE2|nr:tyrosine-type recombinase/integrase [Synechococcus sp. CC9605]ABB35469.1 possible phage integrase family [Synechococcus sp. CC9605]
MAVLRHTEPWVKPFRDQVRASTAPDWWVLNNRGRMRLQVKGLGSVSLPYPWTVEGSTQALLRIQQIFKRWAGGQITLAAAAQNADTSSSHQKLNFSQLIEKYRAFVPNAGDTTWKTFYLPVLRNCAKAFDHRPPVDGEALAMQCLAQWEQGSRMRQTSRQKLYGFLNWAVQRGHLKPIYSPPAALPEVLKAKRIGYPLSDAQILQLLDNLPEGEVHDRWRFAIQLCSIYGLRPEELRHLVIKDGVSGAELWTTYQKSMGGTKGAKTEPRRLHPLLLRDSDGSAIDWNLQARLQVGEKLPPLNRDGDGGQALNQYLRRRAVWMAMRDDAKKQGEQLTPYSFRHRFAKGMHAANIPIANISEAMGHTIEVHLKSYARFKPNATADLVAAVNL